MRINFRLLLLQALSISSTIASPLMLWKGLSIATNTESPIVVVLSGSMEPAFSRGDILFLTNPLPTEYIKTGDIVVYKVPGADIPIVHRVIEIHDATPHEERSDSGLQTLNPGTIPINQKILTKGDNNPVDDLTLYGGMEWLERKHIVGTVKGFLPYVGFASIWLNELRRSLFSSIS